MDTGSDLAITQEHGDLKAVGDEIMATIKNLDIYRFINSRDIRKHLQTMKYQFNALEAAWLVYQSFGKSYKEKHKAWKWIIENMPDCVLPKSNYAIARPSLHDYLKELMEYRSAHKKRIKKGKAPSKKMSDEEWDLYKYTFESRWYCFPTPFKKGDIVYDCRYRPHDHDFCRGTFVLEGIANTEEDIKRCVHSDTSDMLAWGYFAEGDGTIYTETMSNYMDLEIFKGELKGQERIQLALSNHIKGEIGLDLLLQSQRTLMMRDYDEDGMVNWYTDEGLELAGIAGLPKLTKKQKRKNRKRRKKIVKEMYGEA